MTHIDLDSSVMKPGAVVRYEIAQDHTRAKKLFVAAVIAAAMILVLSAMFISLIETI